ncbi:MAG: hypothetical protein ACI4GA_03645, partial [Acutalibacteraceae bacterium]
MKTKRLLSGILAGMALTSFAGAFTVFAEEGDVEINKTNFPDDNFREFVSKNCDTDRNGVLSQSEIDAATDFFFPSKNIANLKGIEYFTALTSLWCGNNQLT